MSEIKRQGQSLKPRNKESERVFNGVQVVGRQRLAHHQQYCSDRLLVPSSQGKVRIGHQEPLDKSIILSFPHTKASWALRFRTTGY
jgi:hypothetical protein